MSSSPTNKRVNFVGFLKSGHRYWFFFDDVSLPAVLQTLGRMAADPELEFSWYDAAVLTQKLRRLQMKDSHDAA
jgi:hypothetical protein